MASEDDNVLAKIIVLPEIRLGEKRKTHGYIKGRFHSSSTNSIFGTLQTRPYCIIDTVVNVPLNRYMTLSFLLNNATNVLNATDSYHYPLPGRVLGIKLSYDE